MIIYRFLNNLNNTPDKIALIVDGQRWTYSQLAQTIQKTRDGLLSIGVKKRTHIGFVLNNSYEFVAIMLAAAAIGAVIVPLNPTIKSHALTQAIEACDIVYIVAEKDCIDNVLSTKKIPQNKLISIGYFNNDVTDFNRWQNLEPEKDFNDAVVVEISENDDFIITMTSGSTGKPKPIVLTQHTKILRAENAQSSYKLTANDIIIAATPLYHSLALRLVLLPLITGATSVVMTRFTPVRWLQYIAEYKVTFSILVSSQIATIFSEYQKKSFAYDLSPLVTLVSSSALMLPGLKKLLVENFSFNIYEIYGASEVGVVSNLSPLDLKSKLNTVGTAVDGVTVKIVDASGNSLPAGKIGEIACTSEMVFKSYYKQPSLTKKSKRNNLFYTGDMGKIDQDGYLSFVSRQKDIIITGGINVYPADIEQALMSSGLLRECCALGVDDERLGEAITAIIVPQVTDDALVRKLQRICYKLLTDYQQPLHYEVINELPKNAMGKVDKLYLKEKYSGIDLAINMKKIFD